MMAITVRQPWASAIISCGKNVENRRRNWSHRGTLAVHAGAVWDRTAAATIAATCGRFYLTAAQSAIIGLVDLVDVHQAGGCCDPGGPCAPWGFLYPNDRLTFHWVLANPRKVEPIPCKGSLGPWTVPDDIAAQLVVL